MKEVYALFQILMSVTQVNTAVIKSVAIEKAATDALVNGDIHSYLIKKHVKVRKKEFF